MRVTQEADQVSPRVISIVALLAVLATAVGAGGAWLLQKQRERSLGVSSSESITARWGHPPEERNAVETSLFGSRSRPLRETEAHGPPPQSAGSAATERLGSYGWSDRERGTVHIPIDRAMLLYVAKAANARGAPSARTPGSEPALRPPAGSAP
jgi:hypothetical protein